MEKESRSKGMEGLLRNNRGLSLIEVVIGVALLGIALASLVVGLSTGSLVVGKVGQRGTVQDLARAQLEDVKTQPYVLAPTTYPSISVSPPYTTSAIASPQSGPTDQGIQLITVTVYFQGSPALEIQAYKVNR
ncbi:MAG: prepilin-type N-terminal cleavage/methylation domain-containing protein [Chloroflexi bacterium]|nr:prepilin-type N-terminal cleavage/methylation domain-containing protein [Chloroflexota bacterium]